MALFTGSGVAMITPMHEDKSVNYEMLKTLLEWQIAEGTEAIIICGTTGEPCTLTWQERRNVISCAIETVAHRVPVIAGCGSNCTAEAVEASREAQILGADGILVVTPYYNKATQGGLYAHYSEIARAVSVPIIMYNVPSRTGCNLTPQTAVKLGREYPHIVAVKEASGNISQVAQLASLIGEEDCLDIYSGNDDQILPILSLGGKGVISVLGNVAPHAVHDMVWEYMQGNIKRSRMLQLQYMPLIQALFSEVNPIPVKRAMEMLGYRVGGTRLPLTELEQVHEGLLLEALQKCCR